MKDLPVHWILRPLFKLISWYQTKVGKDGVSYGQRFLKNHNSELEAVKAWESIPKANKLLLHSSIDRAPLITH